MQRIELTRMSSVKHDETKWIIPFVVLMLTPCAVTLFTVNRTCTQCIVTQNNENVVNAMIAGVSVDTISTDNL